MSRVEGGVQVRDGLGGPTADITLTSAHQARRFIAGTLAAWGLDDLARPAVMVGHELVANALRHGATPARLRLVGGRDRVMIEVFDSSDELPSPPEIDNATSPSGRGIRIVESLTDDWGVRLHGTGKTVWATITR